MGYLFYFLHFITVLLTFYFLGRLIFILVKSGFEENSSVGIRRLMALLFPFIAFLFLAVSKINLERYTVDHVDLHRAIALGVSFVVGFLIMFFVRMIATKKDSEMLSVMTTFTVAFVFFLIMYSYSAMSDSLAVPIVFGLLLGMILDVMRAGPPENIISERSMKKISLFSFDIKTLLAKKGVGKLTEGSQIIKEEPENPLSEEKKTGNGKNCQEK